MRLFRIQNGDLPEPYMTWPLSTALYFTDTGHVIPEGTNKSIDIFDSSFFEHLSKDSQVTDLSACNQIYIPESDTSDIPSLVKKHRNILKSIQLQKYATIKGIVDGLQADKAYIKMVLTILMNLQLCKKYHTYTIINPEYKDLIDFELGKE